MCFTFLLSSSPNSVGEYATFIHFCRVLFTAQLRVTFLMWSNFKLVIFICQVFKDVYGPELCVSFYEASSLKITSNLSNEIF